LPVFRVDQSVFDLFPNARFSAVVLSGANNSQSVPEIDRLLDEAIAHVRSQFAEMDPKTHPNLAIWREAFSARGWTPSKYLSSIEALVRRLAKGGEMPRINSAVDLANSVSLLMLVPIGAHDLDTAPDGIVVRVAEPMDRFQPMGDAVEETPEDREIVYVHQHDVRTRRWVWRQSRTGLLSADATNILFPIDGFAPTTDGAVRKAAQRLAELGPQLLGGTATIYHLDPKHPNTD
jgi:DNA/RNA-binding domain of Phe-tRNA-synthetase-like protein